MYLSLERSGLPVESGATRVIKIQLKPILSVEGQPEIVPQRHDLPLKLIGDLEGCSLGSKRNRTLQCVA